MGSPSRFLMVMVRKFTPWFAQLEFQLVEKTAHYMPIVNLVLKPHSGGWRPDPMRCCAILAPSLECQQVTSLSYPDGCLQVMQFMETAMAFTVINLLLPLCCSQISLLFWGNVVWTTMLTMEAFWLWFWLRHCGSGQGREGKSLFGVCTDPCKEDSFCHLQNGRNPMYPTSHQGLGSPPRKVWC